MEKEELTYSQRILNVCNLLPETFYHENLESLRETGVLLKYTNKEKLVEVEDRIETLVNNLENSFQIYSSNPYDMFCEQDLGIAITNIHFLLLDLRELLGLKTLEGQSRK